MISSEERVRAAFERARSTETAKQWSKENPANGRYDATSALIQDTFGGEILVTCCGDVWHFYNCIQGEANARCRRTQLHSSEPFYRCSSGTQSPASLFQNLLGLSSSNPRICSVRTQGSTKCQRRSKNLPLGRSKTRPFGFAP